MFENDYLMHHGIKGQKWGVRRYQNTDGSWTAAGRARYSKGNGSRAKYGSQLNSYDKMKVAHLNEQIDELNGNYQRSHAGRRAALDSKPLKERRLTGTGLGIYGAALGTAAGMAGADAIAKTTKGKALLTAAGTIAGGLGAAKLGTHLVQKNYDKQVKRFKDEPFSNDVRMELNRLIQERNHLDPSQKNRKGRVITKEEYSDYYNTGRNALEGGNKHKDLVSDEMYNDYLKNTTTYGSKKNAKYGSQLDPKTAKRVEELNRQIDKENLKLQKRNARSYGYDQASLKKAAAAGAVTGAAINAASASDSTRSSLGWFPGVDPADIDVLARRSAVNGAIGGAGAGAAAGALKGAAIKAVGKSSVGKTSRESKIKRMIAERNELDPSQASRKGRTLTAKEFNRQVNAAKGATLGGSATPILLSPIGAAIGSAVGSRSTKGKNTYDYNDYLKNTTTYGSKKKRR